MMRNGSRPSAVFPPKYEHVVTLCHLAKIWVCLKVRGTVVVFLLVPRFDHQKKGTSSKTYTLINLREAAELHPRIVAKELAESMDSQVKSPLLSAISAWALWVDETRSHHLRNPEE